MPKGVYVRTAAVNRKRMKQYKRNRTTCEAMKRALRSPEGQRRLAEQKVKRLEAKLAKLEIQ